MSRFYCSGLSLSMVCRVRVTHVHTNLVWKNCWLPVMRKLTLHRPLQKRERTGKEYGCFPFA